MKFLEEVEKTGKIPRYNVENEIDNLSINPDKPSARILQTDIGLKTIALLKKIMKDNNHSWYAEIKERAQDCPDKAALFYRANKISYREMFEKADQMAKSLAKEGLKKGDKVACCLSNTPELVYLMLAANKIGLTLIMTSANLDREYMKSILDKSTKKVFFCTDNTYNLVKDVIDSENYEKKVIFSLADSLPKNPKECDEYEPDLDEFYHYRNLTEIFKIADSSILSTKEYLEYGKDYDKEIIDDNDLNTEFTITFTSGSTRIGFPKQIVHCNRSYIVGGIYNDTNLTGSPSVPEIRGLAHIHSDSNTNLVTAISDNLIKRGTVALEPEYNKNRLLDYIMINKPVHLDATTSFLVQAAKDYLVDKKFHEDGKGRKLPQMLVTMAVGEKASKGEEKFINMFLREAKAGSGISLNGFKVPYGPLSIGGGDCEHGGIYYTLLKGLQSLVNTFRLHKEDYGMVPVPFSTVTALKQLSDGSWEECNYGEYGIIVANSITSMECYDGDKEKTINKIIRDKYGRDWMSCDVYGYINKLGNVIIKGRKEDVIKFENGEEIPTFVIDDIVGLDTKNIMSCSTVCVSTENGDIPVVNIEFSPLMKKNKIATLAALDKRCKKYLPDYVNDKIALRIIDNTNSFPLTGSGKRNIPALQQMGLYNTYKNENGLLLPYIVEHEQVKNIK